MEKVLKEVYEENELENVQQRKQFTYNVTSWSVRLTVFAMETQQCVPFVLLLTCM
jgi:hypothetical protein